jgi:hypothetical protein
MQPDSQQPFASTTEPVAEPNPKPADADLWCAACARVVADPLVCGDCSAVICRLCGAPLESADELAFG